MTDFCNKVHLRVILHYISSDKDCICQDLKSFLECDNGIYALAFAKIMLDPSKFCGQADNCAGNWSGKSMVLQHVLHILFSLLSTVCTLLLSMYEFGYVELKRASYCTKYDTGWVSVYYFTHLKPGSQYDAGASVASCASWASRASYTCIMNHSSVRGLRERGVTPDLKKLYSSVASVACPGVLPIRLLKSLTSFLTLDQYSASIRTFSYPRR